MAPGGSGEKYKEKNIYIYILYMYNIQNEEKVVPTLFFLVRVFFSRQTVAMGRRIDQKERK